MNEIKPTIMIVDDDAEIRSLVKIILEESDYHTLEAASSA
ncbi:MAG: two-component system response regulator KdpE, partial [Verrucomicrobia bacterium]